MRASPHLGFFITSQIPVAHCCRSATPLIASRHCTRRTPPWTYLLRGLSHVPSCIAACCGITTQTERSLKLPTLSTGFSTRQRCSVVSLSFRMTWSRLCFCSTKIRIPARIGQHTDLFRGLKCNLKTRGCRISSFTFGAICSSFRQNKPDIYLDMFPAIIAPKGTK